MKKQFVCLVLLSILQSTHLSAQSFRITDKIDYRLTHKNLTEPFVGIEMVNDFNPIFTTHTNDEGYTLGTNIYFRLKAKNSFDFMEGGLKSDLYTRYFRNDKYLSDNRTIIPQYFNEISYLNFYYRHFLEKYNLFLSLGGGAGVNNKEKALWGLPLYFQGGSDGRGGYHKIIPNNNAEDNIPTGKIEPLFFFQPSIIKYFSVASDETLRSKPYLSLETGVRIGTTTVGSNAFFSLKSEIPVLQFYRNDLNLFRLSLILKNDLICHADGLLELPELGTEVKLLNLNIGFTSIFILGKQNVSVIRYADNETLMRGYIKVIL